MAEGFTTDHVLRRVELPVWHAGPFKRSFWSGLGLGKRQAFFVQTWRCTDCGYLESYGRHER